MITGAWSRAEDAKLTELRGLGLSATDIAKDMNRGVNSVRNRTYKIDAPLAPNVDENFFARNDEISNYVLGYWLADGCIMKKSGGHYFSIVSIDKQHLLDIAKEMKVKTKLYKNSNNAYEIRVGNKGLVNNLISIGGRYNKTHTISLDDITFTQKHFRHLLRGYFDGDGGFQYSGFVKKNGKKSVSSIKFTGSSKLIHSFRKHIGMKASIYEESRHKDCCYLQYYGNEMRELADYMYSDCEIALKRKEDVYLKQKEW